MTDLTDRIAAVLYRQHYRYGNPDDITWDELEEDLQNRYRQDADAVIEALGLTIETATDKWIGGSMDLTRYVTEWETTDE